MHLFENDEFHAKINENLKKAYGDLKIPRMCTNCSRIQKLY